MILDYRIIYFIFKIITFPQNALWITMLNLNKVLPIYIIYKSYICIYVDNFSHKKMLFFIDCIMLFPLG